MKPEDYLEPRLLRVAEIVAKYSEIQGSKKVVNLNPYGLDVRIAKLFSKLPNVEMKHYVPGGFCSTGSFLKLTITELKHEEILDRKEEDAKIDEEEYPLAE